MSEFPGRPVVGGRQAEWEYKDGGAPGVAIEELHEHCGDLGRD